MWPRRSQRLLFGGSSARQPSFLLATGGPACGRSDVRAMLGPHCPPGGGSKALHFMLQNASIVCHHIPIRMI